MAGDNPLASTSTPAIAEHLISRLLGKGLPVAIVVVAEELANLKMYDYLLTKNGQVIYRPGIPAVHMAADMTAIRADAIIQGRGCVQVKYVAVMNNLVND